MFVQLAASDLYAHTLVSSQETLLLVNREYIVCRTH